MDKIRFGVIGLKFGQYLVRTLAHLDNAQLVAVADRSTKFVSGIETYAAQYAGQRHIKQGKI